MFRFRPAALVKPTCFQRFIAITTLTRKRLKAYSLKKFTKLSSLRDWFSAMDEFVSKFDSRRRLVGLGIFAGSDPTTGYLRFRGLSGSLRISRRATMAVVPVF